MPVCICFSHPTLKQSSRTQQSEGKDMKKGRKSLISSHRKCADQFQRFLLLTNPDVIIPPKMERPSCSEKNVRRLDEKVWKLISTTKKKKKGYCDFFSHNSDFFSGNCEFTSRNSDTFSQNSENISLFFPSKLLLYNLSLYLTILRKKVRIVSFYLAILTLYLAILTLYLAILTLYLAIASLYLAILTL